MTRYGIATDYDYGASHGREYINIWSGSFMGTWEAQAYPTRGAKQITVTTYNDDKVIVKLPDGVTFPRTDENYQAIDDAINEALNEYERQRGSVQMMPDLPPGDDGTPSELPDPPAPGADDH